jgi:hypothetical protein
MITMNEKPLTPERFTEIFEASKRRLLRENDALLAKHKFIRAFNESVTLQRITTLGAYVCDQLRQSGYGDLLNETLTAEEKKESGLPVSDAEIKMFSEKKAADFEPNMQLSFDRNQAIAVFNENAEILRKITTKSDYVRDQLKQKNYSDYEIDMVLKSL